MISISKNVFHATPRCYNAVGPRNNYASLDIIIAKLKEAAEFMGLIDGKETPKPDKDKGNNDADLVKKFEKMETLSEAINRNFKDVFTSFRDANQTVIKVHFLYPTNTVLSCFHANMLLSWKTVL